MPDAPLVPPVEKPKRQRVPGSGRRKGRKDIPANIRKKDESPKPLPVSEKMLLLEYFPELFLGEKPYIWQFNVLKAIGKRGSRVALRANNNSGKTSWIVANAVMWHMMRFQGSQTVCTAGVFRQVADVLWPLIRTKSLGLGGEEMGWKITENRIIYTAPAGPGQKPGLPALCVGFSADKPESAEGWHARGPTNNLLYVIDEAKAVADGIFDAMERCQPTRVLETSSPGGRAGRFYERFAKQDQRYDLFKVTAYDCPHITHEWIDQQVATYGLNSPLVQSMIFAEFGEDDGVSLVLPPGVLQKCISSPPLADGKGLWAGCDFAAGGDENVICFREGNAVKGIVAWREKDTMAAVGRFITEFKRMGVEPDHVYADAGGIGIPICDALREAGWPVNRVNNGEAARNPDHFANRGVEMWTQFARQVELCRVVLPADEVLHRQLTTRRLNHNSKGKLILESKEDMAKRGLSSPDRADAVILAFCGMGPGMEDYLAKYGQRVTFDDLEDAGVMADAGGKELAGAHAG